MSELRHYRYIDALRGWAFLGVMTIHSGHLVPGWRFAPYTEMCQYGVQLFYLLSAITLLRSMAVRTRQENYPLGNFFIRRFFRIAPLFWVAILFSCAKGLGPNFWNPDGMSWVQIISTALFLNGWWPTTINSVVPGGWSVAVEMTFYVCLPFLAARIKSVWTGLVFSFYAMIGSIIIDRIASPIVDHTLSATERHLNSGFFYFWFPTQLPVFLLGMATYYALQNKTISHALAQPGRPIFLMAAAAYCLLALNKIGGSNSLIPEHYAAALIFTLIILALHAQPLALFVNKLTCALGVISYSCYLTHFVVLDVLNMFLTDDPFPSLPGIQGQLAHFGVVWVLTLIFTVGASTLTYILVEKPGIALGRWLIARRENRERPVPAEKTVLRPASEEVLN